MVCKFPPKPTYAPDPLILLALPAEFRVCIYEQIWEFAEGYEEKVKTPYRPNWPMFPFSIASLLIWRKKIIAEILESRVHSLYAKLGIV